MISVLALFLTLMPPAAASHHDQAMEHYKAGRHAEAFAEFHAAYAAMTDVRGDRHDREQVLATMRGMLLVEHEQSGAVRPLCDLQALLQAHVAALRAAHPEPPEPPEIAHGEQRLAEVTSRLAAFPPDACQPAPPAPSETPPEAPEAPSETPPQVPPPPVVTAAPAPASPAPASPPSPPPDGAPAKRLRVAGGVTLGVSGALLGVMAYGIADGQRHAAAARKIDREVIGDITPDQYAALVEERDRGHTGDRLAIATGCAAAGTAAVGVALLLVARKRTGARAGRVSVAPWWLSSGTGVTLRVFLP